MNRSSFLEQLADKTHHSISVSNLINAQPAEIAHAYLFNDNAQIRQYLGESEMIANPSDVVQI